MPVLVIVSQALPGILELLRPLYRMRVVVSKNPLSVRLVERQRITDSVWDVCCYLDTPSLDLHPIATVLINDLIVEV
jgi:hypothetical protein